MDTQHSLVFGPHLTVDLVGVKYEIQSDLKLHYDFLYNLPELIGMTRIELPRVFPYSGLVPEDCGITGLVTLAESHCSVHSFEKKGWSFLDLFSCRPINTDECMRYILEIFKPERYDMRIVERGIGFPR